MTDAFVLGGVRTPVGRYGGSLSHIRTDDLLGQTMVAACERVGVPLERIEDIAAGCVNPAHEGMGDIARWAALAAGFPDSVPAIDGEPLLRLVAVVRDPDRARDPQRRAVGRPRRRRRVDVAVGLGADEGRGAVHAARAGASCSTRCGPARAARPTRRCWRATPTSR